MLQEGTSTRAAGPKRESQATGEGGGKQPKKFSSSLWPAVQASAVNQQSFGSTGENQHRRHARISRGDRFCAPTT